MQEFRNLVSGPIGKTFLGLIVASFVASAFYSYFAGTSRSSDEVAEVNGKPIYKDAVDNQVRDYRQRLMSRNPNLDPKQVAAFVSPAMVLHGMIGRQLVLQHTEDANMLVSRDQAGQVVLQNPQFQEKGEFSADRYKQLLQSNGLTPKTYLDNVRKEMVTDQLRAGYINTDFGLPGELDDIRKLQDQTRDIRYFRLKVADLRSQYTVSDAEIKTYYQNHQGDFMRPAQYKLNYIDLDPSVYRDKVKVTDDDIAREYKARIETLKKTAASDQRRDAADILININDKRTRQQAEDLATSLRKKLESGADFGTLARKYSDDVSTASEGGDLGAVARGALPKELEDVLFAMQPGDISQPVVSGSAVHLLKLKKIEQPKVPTLADMHDSIKADLIKGRADAMLSDDVNKLEDLAFEHTDLQAPAKQLGLKLQSTNFFSLDNPVGIAKEKKVQQALQKEDVISGHANSDLLDMGKEHYLVIHVADTKPASPIPLAEVTDNIRNRIQRQKASDALKKIAADIRQALDKKQSLDQIAGQYKATVDKADNVKRHADKPGAALVRDAFLVPRPGKDGTASTQMFTLPDGDVAVIAVTKVHDNLGEKLDKHQEAIALTGLGQQKGQASFSALMSWLQQTGDVKIHASKLQEQADDSGNQ